MAAVTACRMRCGNLTPLLQQQQQPVRQKISIAFIWQTDVYPLPSHLYDLPISARSLFPVQLHMLDLSTGPLETGWFT